jgi:hypothetical protein
MSQLITETDIQSFEEHQRNITNEVKIQMFKQMRYVGQNIIKSLIKIFLTESREITKQKHFLQLLLDTLPVLNSNDCLDKIPLVNPREVAEEIRKRKALVKLTTLINACIRLNYIPDAWKIAELIMTPKPAKNLREMESYLPISLLPIMSKLFQKLILTLLKPIIAEKHLMPTHLFGFRKKSLDNRPGASYH